MNILYKKANLDDFVYDIEMTFKDLKKRISNNQQLQQQDNQSNSLLLNRLRDKPFWIWNVNEHKKENIRTKGYCCFNHVVGLPTKDGVPKAIFDYEQLLYNSSLLPEFNNPLHHSFKHREMQCITQGRK